MAKRKRLIKPRFTIQQLHKYAEKRWRNSKGELIKDKTPDGYDMYIAPPLRHKNGTFYSIGFSGFAEFLYAGCTIFITALRYYLDSGGVYETVKGKMLCPGRRTITYTREDTANITFCLEEMESLFERGLSSLIKSVNTEKSNSCPKCGSKMVMPVFEGEDCLTKLTCAHCEYAVVGSTLSEACTKWNKTT